MCKLKNLLSAAKRAVNRAPESRDALEIRRLEQMPRYVQTTTDLLGFDTHIPDGPSFAAVWREVFQNGIYEFLTSNASPRILDCGANVGLASLFFKRKYPMSHVTAFEPDPKIFPYLKHMIEASGMKGIDLVDKAVWSSATTLRFSSEGSDANRIGVMPGTEQIEVQTVRLREYLHKPIDLLKMDIEGAETDVLRDCADLLVNVRNLFVEYHSFVDKPQTMDLILSTLKSAGFRLQVHPMMSSPKPFLHIREHLGMDLQLNVFAYRT